MPGRPGTPEERFWPKVRKIPDGCWLWLASINPKGYGQFWDGERWALAHRFAYRLLIGPIPGGLPLDHLCRVHGCVNPAHLEPVTDGENNRRGEGWAGRARQMNCKRNHPLSGDNLIVRERPGLNPQRECRECRRMRKRVAWRQPC
jgi:hypothetical protein